MKRFLWRAKLRIGAAICSRVGHDFDRLTSEDPHVYEGNGSVTVWINRMCSRCEHYERFKRGTK